MDILNLNEFERTYITGMLLAKAFEKHGFDITPCNTFKDFSSGLMFYNETVHLYYNTPNHSTHIVKLLLSDL